MPRLKWRTVPPTVAGWYAYTKGADDEIVAAEWTIEEIGAAAPGFWRGPLDIEPLLTPGMATDPKPYYTQQNWVVLDSSSQIVHATTTKKEAWSWIVHKGYGPPMRMVRRHEITSVQWQAWVKRGGSRMVGRPAVIGVPIDVETLPDLVDAEEPYIEDNSSEAWKKDKDPEDDKDKDKDK